MATGGPSQRLAIYERLVQNSPNMFAIVDRDYRYQIVNAAYLRMRNKPLDQIIGHTAMEIMGAEGFEQARPYMERCFAGELTRYSGWFEFLDQGQHFLEVAYHPLIGPDGQVDAIGGELHDATDRRRAEDALRASDQRYRLHFEQANDVIASLTIDDRFAIASPSMEKVLGYRPDELIGRSVQELGLLCPEDLPRMAADKARVLGGEHVTSEYRLRAKDGTLRWCEVSQSRLIEDGRPVGGLIVGRDITDRKRAEEALLQLNAQLEQRVAARTAAVEEANRKLQAEIAERQRTEERLRRALDQLRELGSQIVLAEERERRQLAVDLHDAPAQMLVVAKMKLALLAGSAGGTGSRGTEQRAVLAEIGELVDQAHAAVRSLTFQLSPPTLYDLGLLPALEWLAEDFGQRYHLTITVEDDGQPKPADEPVRVILFRCVRELLMNVVKHAVAREARIELRRENDRLLVAVADDGKGFEPPSIEGERDGAGVRRGPAGFGLFSIRERLTHVGGRVTIRSAPAAGTTVTMEMPLAGKGET